MRAGVCDWEVVWIDLRACEYRNLSHLKVI